MDTIGRHLAPGGHYGVVMVVSCRCCAVLAADLRCGTIHIFVDPQIYGSTDPWIHRSLDPRIHWYATVLYDNRDDVRPPRTMLGRLIYGSTDLLIHESVDPWIHQIRESIRSMNPRIFGSTNDTVIATRRCGDVCNIVYEQVDGV